jgi:superfamily II DNA or RNA helicase
MIALHGENRSETNLIHEEDGTLLIPQEVIQMQNRSSHRIYVENEDMVWYSEYSRNGRTEKVRNEIRKDEVSESLLNIILHNDRTKQFDNFSRLEYILNASNALFTKNRGVISLPTGSGKTLVIALLVEQMKDEKVLIVAPTLVIIGQIKSLLKKLNVLDNVDVLTPISAAKITPDKINGLPKYDCIIFDESHKMQSMSYLKTLLRSETKRIYGLSASISKYGVCSSKFHIGELVYNLPYDIARNLKSCINGIKHFHKFEFGKSDSEGMRKLKDDLSILEIDMIRQINSIRDRGWSAEFQKQQIIARFVNMGFLLAEKSDERNTFVSKIIEEITKKGLLNITFLRTKECGRLLIKKMKPKTTLFWCAEGMYIYEKEGDLKLKKVDYEYVDDNFGKELNNILATSVLKMGVNLQFTHGTINSILLLSGSTHNSLAQEVGRAVRGNPSPLDARAHTIIDHLPLLSTNAENRVKDLSKYFNLQFGREILHTEANWLEEYTKLGNF